MPKLKVLTPASEPSSVGPAENFTGSVRITPLAEPGARSAWHTHPKGQLLVVTEGAGLIQQWGSLNGKVVEWMEKVTDEEYGAG